MTSPLPVYAYSTWPPNASGKGDKEARHLLRNPEGDPVCPCCFLVFENEQIASVHVVNKHPAPGDTTSDFKDDDSEYPAPRAADPNTTPGGGSSTSPTVVDEVVGRAILSMLKAGAF